MYNQNVKVVSVVCLVFCLMAFLFGDKKEDFVWALPEDNVNVVEEIIKNNEKLELVSNETYQNNFVYLAFQKDDVFSSYFVDVKSGNESDFLDYVKEKRKEEFINKINDLVSRKYPKFISDVLTNPETKKYYQICSDKILVHYSKDQVVPSVLESIYIEISAEEIKDYLKFKFKPIMAGDAVHVENKKAIALTFDDGPNGERTNKIVELLEQNKAHATFFMVGNKMEAGKNVILNVLNKGNEIGSHSYNHKNMKRMKLKEVIESEAKTKEIYYKITGREYLYTRPPYGNINKKIKENIDTIFVNWNLDTEDWLHRDKNYIVDYVLENVKDGAIILMHDSYDSTVDAVRDLLPKLYAKGYQVLSISELAKLKGKTLKPNNLYRSISSN